jgi:hypothetical protein
VLAKLLPRHIVALLTTAESDAPKRPHFSSILSREQFCDGKLKTKKKGSGNFMFSFDSRWRDE